MERNRVNVHRVENGRFRYRFASQVFQAQQFLQLRSSAQHLRVPEGRAGEMGIRQRSLPARGEGAPRRDPASEEMGSTSTSVEIVATVKYADLSGENEESQRVVDSGAGEDEVVGFLGWVPRRLTARRVWAQPSGSGTTPFGTTGLRTLVKYAASSRCVHDSTQPIKKRAAYTVRSANWLRTRHVRGPNS